MLRKQKRNKLPKLPKIANVECTKGLKKRLQTGKAFLSMHFYKTLFTVLSKTIYDIDTLTNTKRFKGSLFLVEGLYCTVGLMKISNTANDKV